MKIDGEKSTPETSMVRPPGDEKRGSGAILRLSLVRRMNLLGSSFTGFMCMLVLEPILFMAL
jgi:hypothetical protein